MDFNQPISLQTASATFLEINTVTSAAGPATPLSGYAVEGVTIGAAGVRGYTVDEAQRDGIRGAEAFLGSRNVTLVVSAYGSSIGNFWDRVDTLSGAMDPYPNAFVSDDGFRQLRFYSPTGSTTKQVYMLVRPASIPGIGVTKNQSVGASAKGFASNTQLAFLAKDPRKISVSEYTVSISAGTTTVAYTGNYKYYPTVIVTASGTSASYTLGGKTVSLIGLSSGTSYYIDHGKATLRIGSATGTISQGKFNETLTTGFGAISSGESVVLSGSASGGSIVYREAWL
jgi:hypothetical protein